MRAEVPPRAELMGVAGLPVFSILNHYMHLAKSKVVYGRATESSECLALTRLRNQTKTAEKSTKNECDATEIEIGGIASGI